MLIIRYFAVVGLALLGLFMLTGYQQSDTAMTASAKVAATPVAKSSIDYWRDSQKRLDRPTETAVVLAAEPSTAPTADRLTWERQLRLVPERASPLEAKAELPKSAPAAAKTDLTEANAIATATPVAAPPSPVVRKRVARSMPTHPRAPDYPPERAYRPDFGDAWASRFSIFN